VRARSCAASIHALTVTGLLPARHSTTTTTTTNTPTHKTRAAAEARRLWGQSGQGVGAPRHGQRVGRHV
jgi:hypothetical protein